MSEQAHAEHHNLPRLQEDWINKREITARHEKDVNSEVMRRLNQEQRKRDAPLGTTDPVPQVQGTQLNTQENNIIEEGDEENNGQTPLTRRYPLHESRRKIKYKGTLGICNQVETLLHQDEISQRAVYFSSESIFHQSSAFFNFTKETFLTNDNTMEDIYICAYLTQLQAHMSETPTYKDFLRRTATMGG